LTGVNTSDAGKDIRMTIRTIMGRTIMGRTIMGRTTTGALMLAASTLALGALPLAAQEATTTEEPATDAAPAAEAMTDTATTDTVTGDTATGETATDDGATDDGATDQTATEEDATDALTAEEPVDEEAVAADATAMEPAEPTPDMQAVLDKLVELGADPIGTLPPDAQRQEPTPADAVMALMEEQGIEPDPALAGILTRDITYPGADGTEIAARVYTPPEGEGPFPLIIYFHGGGWVIAGIDAYDASARALAAGANAVVVSATYRQAPESKFPAAHEDANAAYEWIVENSGSLNADAERLAVAGESAGGNLAMNVAIHARDAQLIQPDHMLLVYPVAGNEFDTPSYQTYADAQPLSRDAMEWFVSHVFTSPEEAADPRINLVDRDDLAGLPPATVVSAQIDPLQSEGEELAQALEAAGVEVAQMTYPGVTHEFFGMGAVVPTAREAVGMATTALGEAFAAQ
jgi:acetyl esterase